jgi:tRNA (guanine37-N1)-methyltransferase
MKFKVVTLFPEFIDSLRDYSIIGRALKNNTIKLETINIRDFGLGRHKQVDDKPYGGGVGMLLKVDVLHAAIKKAAPRKSAKRKVILLSPEGRTFDQSVATELSKLDEIVLVCGHYEGFDRRIDNYVDDKISIGEYVLSGGEIAALAIIDTVSRLKNGVLGKDESKEVESFSIINNKQILEHPQYTRPESYEGENVPEILLSGHHKQIDEWQKDHQTKL